MLGPNPRPISTSFNHESPSPTRIDEWLENLIVNPDPATYKSLLITLSSIEHEICDYQDNRIRSTDETDAKLMQLMKKRKKAQEKIKEWEASAEKKASVVIGTKIKSWFRRKITPDRPLRLGIVLEIDENCTAGREVKAPQIDEGVDDDEESIETQASDLSIHCASKTSHVLLEAARRDLLSIRQSFVSVDEFITTANHAITKADRVAKRAIKKREAMVSDLHVAVKANTRGSPGYLGYNNHIALRPSMASLSSVYSATSSLAMTVSEHDDDDVRALRRLLLRKIESGASSAWIEIEKVTSWLRIVKEVVRGVKRRTYV